MDIKQEPAEVKQELVSKLKKEPLKSSMRDTTTDRKKSKVRFVDAVKTEEPAPIKLSKVKSELSERP
jgi:hypothetical protein